MSRGCCSDKRRSALPSPPLPNKQKEPDMQDSDIVMAEYTSLNKGSHPVIGVAVFAQEFPGVRMRRVKGGWSFDYGYHAGGERFMICRKDAELAPQLYRIIESQVVAEPPKRWSPPPPLPVRLPEAVIPKLSLEEESVALLKAKEKRGFQIDLVPGITPRIAEQIKKDSIDSEEKLLALGEEGLQKYQGLGPTKAKVIIAYLLEKKK